MKRIITAVAFATLAAPVLAGDLPFEQNELDRALPQISVANDQASSAGSTAERTRNQPFEQNELDRALPQVRERADKVQGSDAKHRFTFEQYNPA